MRIPAVARRLFRRSASVLPASVIDALVRMAGPIGPTAVGLPAATTTVVLSPHPDDESLGCGGVIALAAAKGASVTVVFATDGDDMLIVDKGGDLAARRREQATDACRILGARPLFLGLRDGSLADNLDALAATLTRTLAELSPGLVLLPWFGDRHTDHRALNDALAKATIGSDIPIWGFEVWTPLPANRLVDITDAIDVKRRAIAAHSADVRLEAEDFLWLNRYRAAMAHLRGTYAEAFFEASAREYVQHVLATARA